MNNALLDLSKDVLQKANELYTPYATVMMFSGGTDSLTAYHVAKDCGVKIDALMHVNTGTGIHETTQFVRLFAEREGLRYIEADSTGKFDAYVMRKGFMGIGIGAHSFAYHLLKTPFRGELSKHFRRGFRGRKILLLNGVRSQESDNRKRNYSGSYYDVDSGAKSNVWVNHIWDWTSSDCIAYLQEKLVKRNPVSECLGRSGECMCGTVQPSEARRKASELFPKWGSWLDALERASKDKFGWGWGDPIPAWFTKIKAGQLSLGGDFMPMCRECDALVMTAERRRLAIEDETGKD